MFMAVIFNKILRLCFVTAIALMMAGCLTSTTPIEYDSVAPPAQTCTLNIIATINVIAFDNQTVDWQADFGDYWAAVQIPAGSHTFILNYNRYVQDERHFQNGIQISYDNFIAGHTYQLIAAEGAEIGGWEGLCTDLAGTWNNMVNQALEIRIIDVTY